MKIKTTVNIDRKIMIKLNHASTILHISITNIIRILLAKYPENNQKTIMFSPIKYQKHDDISLCKPFHLNLREDEYEYCQDLRKVYKKSLSLIIAESVSKYLNILLKIINNTDFNTLDGFYYKNYYFSQRKKDGIPFFTFFWGLPDIKTLAYSIT